MLALAGNASAQMTDMLHHVHGLAFSADGRQIIVPSHFGLAVYADGKWSKAASPARDYMGVRLPPVSSIRSAWCASGVAFDVDGKQLWYGAQAGDAPVLVRFDLGRLAVSYLCSLAASRIAAPRNAGLSICGRSQKACVVDAASSSEKAAATVLLGMSHSDGSAKRRLSPVRALNASKPTKLPASSNNPPPLDPKSNAADVRITKPPSYG